VSCITPILNGGGIAAILCRVNESRSVSLGGLAAVFRVTGEQTGGVLAAVEHPIEPGVLVPPHVHDREDELTYVIEGEIGARVGDHELASLAAGQYLWKPRGVPHAFWNASGAPARILDVIVPAGFEKFFLELAALLGRGASDGEIDAAGRRYGHTIVRDWIPELEGRYGVRVRG
jgi:quercetin dioxygenase-like cupin family protein